MIFDKKGKTTIITGKSVSLKVFIDRLGSSYDKIKNKNLIINLTSLAEFKTDDLLLFLGLSDRHRKKKRSFVIVTDKVSYDDVPDELIVVPTMQEAHDIIEMEEIERDLGF